MKGEEGKVEAPGDGSGVPVVVVPHAPGPLVRLDADGRRRRDELDELVDELFPASDEGPGWFDVGLLVGAAALIAWGALAGGPPAALAIGLGLLGVGAVLPVRSAWRAMASRRRRSRWRAARERGVPLAVTHPATARLARAHDDLVTAAGPEGLVPGQPGAAAHAAVLEAASLLQGRIPGSPAEVDYVTTRAAAVERLAAVLDAARRAQAPAPDAIPDPRLVVEARDELDALTGGNALVRLDKLTASLGGDGAPG